MSYIASCEGVWNCSESANRTGANKKHCNWALYDHALFTEVGAWTLHKKLSCLSPVFFCLCSKQYAFLGWRRMKTGNEWGACGALCQNVLMISLAWLILNTSRQSAAICYAHLESSVGKRQASVWETVFFWYGAEHQQSAIICDGKVQPGLKRADAERGFLSVALTLCLPHGLR